MKVCLISFGPVISKSNGYFIRVWNIVKELSKSNEIIVLEFPEVYNEDKIKKYNRNVTFIRLRGNEYSSNPVSNLLKKVFTFDPFHHIKFQILSFLELWRHREYISSSDVVIVEGSLIPAGNIIAKLLRKKVVLDTHCINKLLARGYRERNSVVYLLRTIFWDFLERFTIKLSDVIITVSENEKEFVVKEYKVSGSKVFVVPNVIEQPKKVSKEVIEDLRKKLGLENKIIITFVGTLESVQNADAVEYIIKELAPEFWKERKDVVFLIIGKGKERFKYNLPNVIFTGFVKDLAPYLAMSDICIAPLRVGAGTKTKILEYLSYGKPIVTTPVGIEGLENLLWDYPNIYISSIHSFKNTLEKVLSKNKRVGLKRNNLLKSSYKMFRRTLHKAMAGVLI